MDLQVLEGRPEMSISISGVYLDPSTVLPEQVQIPTTTVTTATQSVDSVDDDVITLSSATKVQKLDKQGEPPQQIAQSLGISLTTVELDLGVAPTIDVATGSGGVSASRAGSASTSSDSGTSAASGAGSTSSTHVSTEASSVAATDSGSTSGATPAVSSDADATAAGAAGSSASASRAASSTPAPEPATVAAVAQVAATPIPRNPFA